MANNRATWTEATLGELGEFRNGANFSQNDYGDGLPIVNVKQLYSGRYTDTRQLLQIRPSAVSNADALRLRHGDILFARSSVKASGAGQVAMVGPCPSNAVFSGFIIRFRVTASNRVVPEFLNYLLRSPLYRELLTRIASGTTITNLSQETLAGLEVFFPPLPEQRAIAHILGTMDDKIELNRRMNETLEGMARTIFKSWFVDFDPVRAKAEGRNPGLPKPLADLFPNRFENSELGPIPEAWKTRALYDTAEYVNGLAFRNEDFCDRDGAFPIVKIAELKNGITGQTKYTDKEFDTCCRIDTGDLLYSWSGSPDTSLDVFVWTSGPGWLNQHIFKVNTRSEAEKTFVYYLLRHLRPVLVEIARNKQTTGLGHVTVADMKRLSIANPPQEVLEAFQRQAGPLFSQSFQNQLQDKTLVALRDTLLPKLLSGKIRVAEAHKLAETVL